MTKNDWKEFEIAVSEFIKSIGNEARVTHDVRLPDAHTGFPRQRDVWIEWDLGGHFPVKALISCKYYSRQLDQGDIDHFNGEFISSGAQIGIMYSKEGFNNRALDKAKVLNFHCCKLYKNQPADMPQMLVFGISYVFKPQIWISIKGNYQSYGFKTLKDCFNLEMNGEILQRYLVDKLKQYTSSNDQSSKWEYASSGWEGVVHFREEKFEPLDIHIHIKYRKYIAKIEYTQVSGSYNITSNKFLGSQATPAVDTWSVHPGPGWEEVNEIPAQKPKSLTMMFFDFDAEEAIESCENIPIS